MIKVPLVIILLFLVIPLFPQQGNLVLNPSFEERVDFLFGDPSLEWTRGLRNDTPDYITFTERGEPDFYYRKYIGGLLPVDGNAYAGIFCYRIHPLRGIKEVREFIQVPLKHTMEKDTLYTISFFVALDPESNRAVNNFNVHFSSSPLNVKNEKAMYDLYPKVRFKRTWYDTITWTKLEKEYKSRGNESHLVIGNFSSDKSTGKKKVAFESDMEAKWNMHELEEVAYYYVDNVSILKISEQKQDNIPVLTSNETPREPSKPEVVPDTSNVKLSEVTKDSSIVLNQIYFEFDKSTLLPESHRELESLYHQLLQYPELFIIIEGHTDNFGTFEYNIELSHARAKSVFNFLISKGLDEIRVSYEGYGYTQPLSDNRTEEGRQMNRRVAFRITKTENN